MAKSAANSKLSQQLVMQFRMNLARMTRDVLPDIERGLKGEVEWKPSRVQLLKLVMDRLIPTISEADLREAERDQFEALPRSELERLVALRLAQGHTDAGARDAHGGRGREASPSGSRAESDPLHPSRKSNPENRSTSSSPFSPSTSSSPSSSPDPSADQSAELVDDETSAASNAGGAITLSDLESDGDMDIAQFEYDHDVPTSEDLLSPEVREFVTVINERSDELLEERLDEFFVSNDHLDDILSEPEEEAPNFDPITGPGRPYKTSEFRPIKVTDMLNPERTRYPAMVWISRHPRHFPHPWGYPPEDAMATVIDPYGYLFYIKDLRQWSIEVGLDYGTLTSCLSGNKRHLARHVFSPTKLWLDRYDGYENKIDRLKKGHWRNNERSD